MPLPFVAVRVCSNRLRAAGRRGPGHGELLRPRLLDPGGDAGRPPL